MRQARALQESNSAITYLESVDNQVLFVPLIGNVVNCIEERLIIRGATGDIVIDDHRDNGSRNIESTDILDIEGRNKDVLGQHAGPLVLTSLYLNAQSATAALGKAPAIRLTGGRIEERVVREIVVVAVVHHIVRLLVAAHKGPEGPVPAPGAHAGSGITGSALLESAGGPAVANIGLWWPEGRPGIAQVGLRGVLQLVE